MLSWVSAKIKLKFSKAHENKTHKNIIMSEGKAEPSVLLTWLAVQRII